MAVALLPDNIIVTLSRVVNKPSTLQTAFKLIVHERAHGILRLHGTYMLYVIFT